MKTQDIKEIMIVYNDSDFWKVWDWIGHMVISTIDFQILDTSDKIERFIKSLIPTAIKFIMNNSREISQEEINDNIKYLSNYRFKYNFPSNDPDWEYRGSESLIIDLVNEVSYIR